MNRPAAAALLGAAFLLLGQLFPLPPLVDAVDGGAAADAALAYPAGWLLLAPFSALADLMTFSSKPQVFAWLGWLLGGYWLLSPWRAPRSAARAAGGYALYLAAVALFLAWAFLFPRPMARLALADPDLLAFDLHSHSACSHDGRRSFGPRANARWHEEAGFDASWLTDHNREDCSRAAAAAGRAFNGVELSLHGAHVVALSPHSVIPLAPYQAGQAGLEAFLRDARPRWGALAVLSLPEYWRHHWDGLDALAGLMRGAGGLEVANGSPKALAFPAARRAEAVALARRHGLFPACATDNHGFSRAAYCWNIASLEGWRALSHGALEDALMARLTFGGPEAARVAARRRAETSAGWRAAFDPFLGLWVLARSLPPAAAGISVAWLLALCGAWRAFPRRRKPSA